MTFPLLSSAVANLGSTVGASGEWTEERDVRAGRPWLDSMGLALGRGKAGSVGQWLERATDKVKVWAWENWILSGPCPSSVEQSQRNHLAPLHLSFLVIPGG